MIKNIYISRYDATTAFLSVISFCYLQMEYLSYIQFLTDSQTEFDSLANQIGPFLAVESMAYFEAYAHVLAGMKGISADDFPMAKYIVR